MGVCCKRRHNTFLGTVSVPSTSNRTIFLTIASELVAEFLQCDQELACKTPDFMDHQDCDGCVEYTKETKFAEAQAHSHMMYALLSSGVCVTTAHRF